MNWRVRMVLLLLPVAVLGLAAYLILRSAEPAFEGRPLSAWLREMEVHPDVRSSNWVAATRAIRQMGSNAVPALLNMLEVGDPKWKVQTVDMLQEAVNLDLTETLANVHNRRALMGFRVLGRDAAGAIPRLSRLATKDDPALAAQALAALGEIGGTEILPGLLPVLTNGNSGVRAQAAAAAGSLRSRGGAAIPALLQCLQADDPNLRASAARALAEIALAPDTVIPPLTAALADTNAGVRASAALALSAFGTRAAAALPAVQALPRDVDEFSSRFIPRALVRLQCEMRDGGIIRGPTSEKRIALVFTAHEFAEGGEIILNELAKHNGRGSFFLTGVFLSNPNHAALLDRLANENHYVGPHSDQHLLYCAWEDRRTLVTEDVFTADLLLNAARIPNRGEERRFSRYFLPPFEHYNREIVDWARKQRWTVVNFTPGTRANADYTGEADKNFVSTQTIFESVLKREAEDPHGLNGFILLLHLGSGPGRADKFHRRFGELLDVLAAKGYEFVRVDQLLGPSPFGFGGPPRR